MTTRPMFPHAWDSTMLATFRSCPQKFFRQYVQHWKGKEQSVHLVAGGAFAKGIEVARKQFFEGGARASDAVGEGLQALFTAYGDFECPPDSGKSLDRTLGALEFYFDQYPLGADGMTPLRFSNGKQAIEFSFAEPLDIVHPVSGDPILLTGRADMLADFAGGQYAVDEKTTKSLGPTWAKQWEMRSQFTAYLWAARRAGLNIQGMIVRGISILKTKYDTQQAITYRGPHEVDRWLRQTERDIVRAMTMWDEGYWDYAIDEACSNYGGCQFTRVCKSPEPEVWLPMYFEQRVWDPLARTQLTVPEWETSWNHPPAAATVQGGA